MKKGNYNPFLLRYLNCGYEITVPRYKRSVSDLTLAAEQCEIQAELYISTFLLEYGSAFIVVSAES